jgi:hypothetical protein
MRSRTFAAINCFIAIMALTSCYRGPDSADPRELVAVGALPWGTALPKGLTLDQAGVSFVTRHSACCTVHRNARLDVIGAFGVSKLYFDVLNLDGSSPFSVTFLDGRMIQTPPLGPGESTIVANVRANEIQKDGRIPIVLEAAKNLAAAPNQDPSFSPILLYAVSTDQRSQADPNIVLKPILAS